MFFSFLAILAHSLYLYCLRGFNVIKIFCFHPHHVAYVSNNLVLNYKLVHIFIFMSDKAIWHPQHHSGLANKALLISSPTTCQNLCLFLQDPQQWVTVALFYIWSSVGQLGNVTTWCYIISGAIYRRSSCISFMKSLILRKRKKST